VAGTDLEEQISLSYQESSTRSAACARSTSPIEREPADAWADLVGWRINYEHAAR
jgi:hypothetical protein